MVASKAISQKPQGIKAKPVNWLTPAMATPLPSVCTLESPTFPQATDNAYDAVMRLIQPFNLGTGYHLYCDNFYTSPKLFWDLFSRKIGACGTLHEKTLLASRQTPL
jgi:hypothetical protein